MTWRALSVLAITFTIALALGQPPVVPAKRMSTPPTIDGVIDADEWKSAATFSGLVDGRNGQPAPETGTFWLGYDDKNIYFAARLGDSHPKEIRAVEYRTNTSMTGDDTVSLSIDLSGSLNDFSQFSANPKGATNISITGGRAIKREWIGDIVVKSRITDQGWEAEFKIPWRILPLPKPGARDVRFNVSRRIPRLSRRYSYAFTEIWANTPIWRGVEIPSHGTDRSLKLLPYTYFGAAQGQPPILNSGLDWKAGITNEIFAAGTVNPDNRNIENSILSLDFSRFARIGAETRPFFQEGATYLSNPVFTSQVIPQIDVATQVFGKLGDKTQFGILNAEQFGRHSETVFNTNVSPDPNESASLALAQQSTPGRNNEAYSYSYSHEWGAWSAYLSQMGSQDTNAGHGQSSSFGAGFYQRGVSGNLSYQEVDSRFAPALGFVTETDLKGPSASLYYFNSMPTGALRSYSFGINGANYTRLDGTAYRNDAGGSAGLVTRSGLSLGAYVDYPTFEGSHDATETVAARYPTTDPYRNANISYTGGHFNGDPYKDFNVGFNARPRKGLQVSVSDQIVNLPTWQNQLIGSISWDIGHDQTLGGRLVEMDGQTNLFLTYTRSGNRGIEYYLILGNPNTATFQPSLILKVVVPIQM